MLREPHIIRTMIDVSECECSARCLVDIACRGYGYSDSSSMCLLTELLPTPERMEASSEDWRWLSRSGVRLLGEPCAADRDCSLLVSAATCAKNVCGCHRSSEMDGDGGCRKAGQFIPVGFGRLTSGLSSELQDASLDDCKTTCAANLTCVAFDFSATDKLCSFYVNGITSDAGSGRSVQSFVWRFSQPDGTPPDHYMSVNGSFLGLLADIEGFEAAQACFADNAILMPGVSAGQLAPRLGFLARELDGPAWVGFEDMLEEGDYLSSDGGVAEDIAWDGDQEGGVNESCGMVNSRSLIHDAPCSFVRPAICLFVGENMALRRLSWMNAHHPKAKPSGGNDGSVHSIMHSFGPSGLQKVTWTVDLGSMVQVTSVLYASRRGCCDDLPHVTNRNRLTEVRVGSDPVRFDEQHSARCVWLEQPFMAQRYARMFRCDVPLTGRYVRLIRHRPEVIMDFAELAVFGNHLRSP